MILSSLAQSDRYALLHPLFSRVFDYIRDTNLYALPPGRYNLAGDELIAIVEQVSGRTKAMAQLETHRRYIDIQLILEGDETMGWKPLTDCYNPVAEYSIDRDIRFFLDAPASWIPVPPDHFCIFFPEDAHAPLVGTGPIHKVIFKIAI
jgi:YhcH/YjgK/YiaL family protein